MTEPNPGMLALDEWENHGSPPDDDGLTAMVALRDETEDMRLHARLQRAIDECHDRLNSQPRLRRSSLWHSNRANALGESDD